MNSMRRIDIRQEQRKHWTDRLSYYRKLLRAHIIGFEPAKFATVILDNVLKDLPPQDVDHACTTHHTTEELNGDKMTRSRKQDADALISQSTESVRSFDFVTSDLIALDSIGFEIDWLSGTDFGWSVENIM